MAQLAIADIPHQRSRFFLLGLLATVVLAGCGRGAPNQALLPRPTPSHVFFIDSTASLNGKVEIGEDVYVAPFARLNAGAGQIVIGSGTNVQDNVFLEADQGRDILLGDNIICAHGCTIVGPARLGAEGGDPVFVGFNARVEGAVVQPGAGVGIMSRLGPGVVLHSGMAILPGRSVTTQAEADDPGLGKVAPLTPELRHLFEEVVHVNEALAQGYAHTAAADRNCTSGISQNPITGLHPWSFTPILDQRPTLDPLFRNRLIGHLTMDDPLSVLNQVMGQRVSLRADEGAPFLLGGLRQVEDEVTMHALEGSEIEIGDNCSFGRHSLVHGGVCAGNSPCRRTRLGDDVQVGEGTVVFRSEVGNRCVIGDGALIDGSQLAAGTVVPAHTIIVNNHVTGKVEW